MIADQLIFYDKVIPRLTVIEEAICQHDKKEKQNERK